MWVCNETTTKKVNLHHKIHEIQKRQHTTTTHKNVNDKKFHGEKLVVKKVFFIIFSSMASIFPQ